MAVIQDILDAIVTKLAAITSPAFAAVHTYAPVNWLTVNQVPVAYVWLDEESPTPGSDGKIRWQAKVGVAVVGDNVAGSSNRVTNLVKKVKDSLDTQPVSAGKDTKSPIGDIVYATHPTQPEQRGFASFPVIVTYQPARGSN